MATDLVDEDAKLPIAPPPGFIDHVFASCSGTELSLRIWPADPPVSSPAPFLIWTHGGGWLGGHHFAIGPSWITPGFRQRGYHVISHNYRLGPQARLDDMLADSLECVARCRSHLPVILGADKVDVNRYVICGDSAGGHLASLIPLHLPSPRPRAVIDIYGLTDFVSVQQLDLSDKPLPAPWAGEFSEHELESFLWDRNPANVIVDTMSWNEQELISDVALSKRWAAEPDFRYTRRIRLQAELHIWRSLRRSVDGLIKAVMQPETFADEGQLGAFVSAMSPLAALHERKSKDPAYSYPPTAFLHGTADEDVPVQQSYVMAAALKTMGVSVLESYEEGAPHVFDQKYTGPDVPGWETYIQPILNFVDDCVAQ
ncbi:Alpha/Beta hydrolase protein [Bombardia bombarda]|uniref:Alpha/Beta hydrolase protein n=1 Tax=Bombardia bombarda TaxID=252184 RepID=A0AA39U230_9PEZI|nr:Alpha/Beta hydrolase protein [Bombardia bombarda]